jgi:hypothetical protein
VYYHFGIMTMPNRNAKGWVGPLALLALGAVGCAHPVQKQLDGRWLGQSVENFDDEHVALATGWAKGTSFEFAGSSVTVAIPAEDPRTGSYEVARVDRNDVYLAIRRPDGAVDKALFRLDDEHSIRWMLGDGRSLVLNREE